MKWVDAVVQKIVNEAYMNKFISELINQQIEKEFESAYLYLEFTNYFDSIALYGFASWYRIQAFEEIDHAMKFYDYMHEMNEQVTFLPIPSPKFSTKNTENVLKKGLENEKYVTSLINKIYKTASDNSDFATLDFLKWFINEQREEEANAQTLLDKFNMFGNTPEGLYLLDKEFGKREK